MTAQAPVNWGLLYSGTAPVRYFFNIRAEDGTIPDLVGTHLPDVEALRKHAAAHVVDRWEVRVMAGKSPYAGWLEVVAEYHRSVFQIPL